MKLSSTAQEYALTHLAHVAFPGINVRINTEAGAILTIQNRIQIRFPLLSDHENEQLLAGKLQAKIVTGICSDALPVFAPQKTPNSLGQEIVFPYDIITPTFVLLSRIEELRATQLDKHLRFRFAESLPAHYHCIDFPLVDEYAFLLRNFVKEKYPELAIKSRKTTVIPTHDIDFLCRFSSWFATWKSIIGGDILRDRSWAQLKESLRQYWQFKAAPLEDPMMLGIQRLIEIYRPKDDN